MMFIWWQGKIILKVCEKIAFSHAYLYTYTKQMTSGGDQVNIGIFTDSYFPQVSGVATSIKTLKDDLERKGHQVYIFTTTDPHVPDDAVEPNLFRLDRKSVV